MADDRGSVSEDLHRLGVDVHAALGARMDEALAGLVVAARAQKARRRGALVAVLLLLAPARLDLIAHAGPLLEPGVVVADVILERAPDPVHLVDLDAGPRRGGQADEQAHRPAVVVGEIEEGGVVFTADHGEVSDVSTHSMLQLFVRSDLAANRVASSVYSPPPCGEGLGVGVEMGGHISRNNYDPPPQPSPTRPTGGRERTEFAARAVIHTGFSPRMVTRRIRRRSPALKSVRACSAQRLSHISRSPGRQTCS